MERRGISLVRLWYNWYKCILSAPDLILHHATIMEADKKVLDTFTVADTAPVLVDENVPPKLSIGKKILYHLWDADQHLKSPEVRVEVALKPI